MKKYIFVVNTCISMHTEVMADSLEEAIKEAQERSAQSLCHQCAHGESDVEWVTSGELDGDPASAELVDVHVEGNFMYGPNIFNEAVEIWDKIR